MSVRPLAESDLPQVADLYWRYMRQKKGPAPADLQSSFYELYFTNPWVDASFPPLVYENKGGRVAGFLGAMVRRIKVDGEYIRLAFGGNLVVEPEARSRIAAPRLLETFLAGTQDISLSDSANEISRRILERMGFRIIPALNLHWIRPLRPVEYAVHAASRAVAPALSGGLKLAAKPFCILADRIAARYSETAFRPSPSQWQSADADTNTLLQCLVDFREGYSAWAEYDAPTLEWLLGFMARRTARGQLRKIVLRDEGQKIVGWYIYYVKPGAVGEVVHVGGDQRQIQKILDHLFKDAWEHGVVGLHGLVDRRRMPDFSDKGCIFTCRGGWTIAFAHRQPDLLDRLDRDSVLLSRLDGEWCVDPGE